MKKIIMKYTLQNAVSYGGKANPGAVLGKVLADKPRLRKDVGSAKKEVAEIVKQVNKMGLEKQQKELKKLDPKMLTKTERKQRGGLPNLKGAKPGKVLMRLAPNPNGPLHIGHSRMAILNDEYVKRYKGKLILRFDDTDPKNENKIPMKEAYRWMEEDLKWLGVDYHRIERASAKLEIYYKYFEKMLASGHAYVCTCEQEKWSKLVRMKGGKCLCRASTAKANVNKWKKMLLWRLKEGEAVGRIKTKFEKDPAVRDWVAFRIVDDPQHPLVDKDIKVWPMLDFASAIDDHEFGVTHIIRGKDLAVSEKRQKILYEHMGWKYPLTIVYGKFVTTGSMVISKRKVLERIKKGVYSGYDDPKLVFIKALKRRGILPQTIRNYILSLGISEVETTVDLEILFAENRKLADKTTDRYMVVIEPAEIDISGPLKKSGLKEAKIKYHPDRKKARAVKLTNKIFVQKQDFKKFKGKNVRLLDLFNVRLDKKPSYSKDQSFGFNTKKIHWVSGQNIKVELIRPEGVVSGLGELGLSKLKVGDIIQMLRIGFGRIEKVDKNQVTVCFGHK